MDLSATSDAGGELWKYGLGCFGVVTLGVVTLASAAVWGRRRRLRIRDRRRHEEQLEWRRSGRLPARYKTTYWPDEAVDEDTARMLELGYYVADEITYAKASASQLDVWHPELDSRIPLREHEPAGRRLMNFSHLTTP